MELGQYATMTPHSYPHMETGQFESSAGVACVLETYEGSRPRWLPEPGFDERGAHCIHYDGSTPTAAGTLTGGWCVYAPSGVGLKMDE